MGAGHIAAKMAATLGFLKAEGDYRDPEFNKQFKVSPERINDVFNAYLGFYQVAFCAEAFTTLALIVARKCRHHYYFDILRLRL